MIDALLGAARRRGGVVTPPVDPPADPVDLSQVPTPIALWDWRESTAPYHCTVSTGGDLPLVSLGPVPPRPVDGTPIGRALLMTGGDWLGITATATNRLNLGASGASGATVIAPVLTLSDGQMVVAGIWGETFDPPTRQYALFRDLPAYGGDDMTCFHVSRDGKATPGYIYSTDYSAEPDVSVVGRWEVHAGSYDGAEARSYMNGARHDLGGNGYTRSGDGRRNPYSFPLGLNSAEEDFVVGAIADGTSNWIGYMGPLAVWDRALTDAEVAAWSSQWTPQMMTPTPSTPTVTFHERRGGKPAETTTITETAMTIGTPSTDRLVVVSIYGTWGVPRELASVTIGGVPATIVQQTSPQRGEAWAYALVPSGSTADVQVTWKATIWGYQLSTFTVSGSQKTHANAAFLPLPTNQGSKGLRVPGSTPGGVTLAYANSGNTTSGQKWFAGASAPFFTGMDAQSAYSSSAAVYGPYSLDWPVRFTHGVGTAASLTAITFDPA